MDRGLHIIHKLYYPCKYETLVIVKMLTNVSFVGRAQHMINQTQFKVEKHMQVIKRI